MKDLAAFPLPANIEALGSFVDSELVVAYHLAGLDRVAIVELLAATALRFEMFRLLLPDLQGILVREADEIDLLAVLARVGFDRNESRNPLDEFVHSARCPPVRLRVRPFPKMGLENDDDLGRVLDAAIRQLSPLPALSGSLPQRGARACPLRRAPNVGASCRRRGFSPPPLHRRHRPSRLRGRGPKPARARRPPSGRSGLPPPASATRSQGVPPAGGGPFKGR